MSSSSGIEIPLPPIDYMRLVCGDVPDLQDAFETVGILVKRRLEKLQMLDDGARLLDIGCGCGRVARHLLESPIARYAGFDRHPGMIEWANANVGARDERFEFQLVDVKAEYEEIDNAVGSVSASEFVFPYDDEEFTGVLAASIFTHVNFDVTRHYLTETARVLIPGGRVRASFFLGDATGPMAGSGWNFVIREDELLGAIADAGLEVVEADPPSPSTRQRWFQLVKPNGQ